MVSFRFGLSSADAGDKKTKRAAGCDARGPGVARCGVLVKPHPSLTTGVGKPEPKVKPGGQIAEDLHGQYCYPSSPGPVKGFFPFFASGDRDLALDLSGA